MRITTTSRYGVRALFDVAYHGGGQPTQIKDISRRQKISQRYLEQIFNKLLKAGLLKSRRGPRGGYMLSRDPSEITVGDIISAAQGPIVPVRCLDGEATKKKGVRPFGCLHNPARVERDAKAAGRLLRVGLNCGSLRLGSQTGRLQGPRP